MKSIAIRLALVVASFVGMAAFGSVGGLSAMLIQTLLAVVFAICVNCLTHPAPVFVTTATFILTVIFPLFILVTIGLSAYGSWISSTGAVVSSLAEYGPLWGGELLLPTLAATAVSWLQVKWPLVSSLKRDKHH